jgi:hypothetical protein
LVRSSVVLRRVQEKEEKEIARAGGQGSDILLAGSLFFEAGYPRLEEDLDGGQAAHPGGPLPCTRRVPELGGFGVFSVFRVLTSALSTSIKSTAFRTTIAVDLTTFMRDWMP